MKLKLLAALLALGAAAAPAQPPHRPRLIVAISVDQFSADLFSQYRQHFTGGLRRLEQGVVFPPGTRSPPAPEPAPAIPPTPPGAGPARPGSAPTIGTTRVRAAPTNMSIARR